MTRWGFVKARKDRSQIRGCSGQTGILDTPHAARSGGAGPRRRTLATSMPQSAGRLSSGGTAVNPGKQASPANFAGCQLFLSTARAPVADRIKSGHAAGGKEDLRAKPTGLRATRALATS